MKMCQIKIENETERSKGKGKKWKKYEKKDILFFERVISHKLSFLQRISLSPTNWTLL